MTSIGPGKGVGAVDARVHIGEALGMTVDPALIERLTEALDKPAALALLRRAIGTPSVTGAEAAFAACSRTS
jgi:hypothetical protein